MKSNLNFGKSDSAKGEEPTNGAPRDPREQYYYEEEYDDEVIDLERKERADPPIRKVRAVASDDGGDDMDFNDNWVIPAKPK